MQLNDVTPILNVSDVTESIRWFQKLGFELRATFGEPVTFASVMAGNFTLFLCENSQGGRGKDGVWTSLWVEDVDAVYDTALEKNLKTRGSPRNEPWNVREFLLEHPDGHIFRIGRALA